MSSLIVAVIIVGSVAGISMLLIRIHAKHKRQALNALLNRFGTVAAANGLRFSSQQILGNCVLGLDGVQRKLLVLTRGDEDFRWVIIDLRQVKTCSVKKIYASVTGHKNSGPEVYLEKIVLHFELLDKPSMEIVFYKHFENHVYDIAEMEQKAKEWEAILSQMQTIKDASLRVQGSTRDKKTPLGADV